MKHKIDELAIAGYLMENLRTLIIVLSSNTEKKSVNLQRLESVIMFQRCIANNVGKKCAEEYETAMQRSYEAFVKSAIANLEHHLDDKVESTTDEDTFREHLVGCVEEQKNKA